MLHYHHARTNNGMQWHVIRRSTQGIGAALNCNITITPLTTSQHHAPLSNHTLHHTGMWSIPAHHLQHYIATVTQSHQLPVAVNKESTHSGGEHLGGNAHRSTELLHWVPACDAQGSLTTSSTHHHFQTGHAIGSTMAMPDFQA